MRTPFGRGARLAFAGFGVAVLAVLASAGGAEGAPAAGNLRQITWVTATASLSPLDEQFAVAQALYLRQEGLTLKIQPMGTLQAANNAVVTGAADFVPLVGSADIPILGRGQPLDLVGYFEYTYPFKWSIAVRPDSPVKQVSQLKGKTIGVDNFGTSNYTMGRAIIRVAGLDPDTDVHWVATGDLASAAQALDTGRVDAEVAYDTSIGSWKVNHQVNFRLLPIPPKVPKIGGLLIAGTREMVTKHPGMAVGFARALAKAAVFGRANPEAAARLLYQVYPQLLPPNESLEQACMDAVVITSRRRDLWFSYLKHPTPRFKDLKRVPYGYINPDEWRKEVKFAGYQGKVDPSSLFTNAYIRAINHFSPAAIIRQAKAAKGCAND